MARSLPAAAGARSDKYATSASQCESSVNGLLLGYAAVPNSPSVPLGVTCVAIVRVFETSPHFRAVFPNIELLASDRLARWSGPWGVDHWCDSSAIEADDISVTSVAKAA